MANRLANPLPLRLTWFKNPSGARVPRVSGTLPSGERIRRNFKTEAAAQTFINEHVPSYPVPLARPVVTHLSPEIVRELESCLPDLPAGTTLRQALAFFREHYRPTLARPIADSSDPAGKPVPGAATLWADWLKSTRKAKEDTADQWAITVRRFARETEAVTTFDVTQARLRRWIYAERFEVRTQRDYFDWLNYFCRWVLREKMLALDPFVGLDRPVVKNRPPPKIFTVEQVTALLVAALTDAEGPQMLPHFAITALSGVRKEEAPDLEDGAVFLDDHHLIEVNRTKGGRKRRNAEICPPLLRILTWCREHGLALNYYSERKFDRIRRHAGLYEEWSKDVLRHSYASHHYALHRDIDRLVASMGNSEDVLFQSYVRALPRAAGESFMAIELDYAAPRRTSLEGRRIDRLLARPPVELADEDLRLLRTLLRAATARRGPRPRWQRDDNALAAKLVDVESEFARRFSEDAKSALPVARPG